MLHRFSAIIVCSTVLTSVFTAEAFNLKAQPPGGWHKVQIGAYVPLDFSFSDHENGILLCTSPPRDNFGSIVTDTIYAFVTWDGGLNWNLVSDTAYNYSLYWFDANILQSSNPGYGATDIESKEISIENNKMRMFREGGAHPYDSHAEMMIDSMYGFRFVSYDADGCPCQLIVTHDGWETYGVFGDTLGDPRVGPLDGDFLDSNTIWVITQPNADVSPVFDNASTLQRSLNKGQTWDTISPIRSLSSWLMIRHGFHAEGSSYNELYVIGGKIDTTGSKTTFQTDYAYSSDSGATWKLDSTFPGRAYRISPTSPGSVWCFVVHGFPERSSELNIPRYVATDSGSAGMSPYFADTLYYTSNEGSTWEIDSTTFSGDTMFEMHWYDVTHGFVATMRNGQTYMYRYDPSANAVANAKEQALSLSAFPNPVNAEEKITITGAASNVSLTVTDVLGREITTHELAPSSAYALDTRNCAPGVYFARATTNGGVVTARFVVSR